MHVQKLLRASGNGRNGGHTLPLLKLRRVICNSWILVDHSNGGLSHGEIVARSAESECVSGVMRVEWSIGV